MKNNRVISFPEYISCCCRDKLDELLLTGIEDAIEVIQGTTALEAEIL